MDTAELKAEIVSVIDAHQEQITELSRKIHENPEVGFHEVLAAAWLTDYLQDKGFSIEHGTGGLATAFTASYGQGKPVIALIAEYDALPELGHACGHNLIAASATGAAIAARAVTDQFNGNIMVIGTPAEELHGGKAIMASKGVFNSIDIAMMVHPSTVNTATTETLALQVIDIEFTGKPAHAAARPEAGINALDAMIQSFTAINSLRQHIRSTARVHGIITSGGEAPNIVPAHTAATFIVRAKEDDYLDELKEKVLNCFMGASQATGAQLKYQWDSVRYASIRNNLSLARLFSRNMKSLGRRGVLSDPGSAFGSTDMGNVSQLLPSIHARVAIARKQVLIHTPEFALAAISEAGIKGMLDAAKAMAMTVADLLTDGEAMNRVRTEFERGD
ncbi:MAG: M20 family metallopeptidase [Dehalococcoidales bacterium]|nr:MAG: M20 family metallopeptidase [Dehalococcoidales bacterium]